MNQELKARTVASPRISIKALRKDRQYRFNHENSLKSSRLRCLIFQTMASSLRAGLQTLFPERRLHRDGHDSDGQKHGTESNGGRCRDQGTGRLFDSPEARELQGFYFSEALSASTLEQALRTERCFDR